MCALALRGRKNLHNPMSEALANSAWFYVDLLAIAKGLSECGPTARVQQSRPAPTSVLAVRAKSVVAESRVLLVLD
jgi:hypothetical protein